MNKVMRYILMCAISLFAFSSCDIHEFPAKESKELVPFTLHLNFNTEMPLHKEVDYTRNTTDGVTKTPYEAHDFRYMIKAYRTDNVAGSVYDSDTTFIFTRSDYEDSNYNYTATIELPEGEYTLRAWCDFIDAGSTADKYYNTELFNKVYLLNDDGENHSGSNDYRDAFRGTVSTVVTNPRFYSGDIVNTFKNEATIEMSRPMAKFEFISTDLEAFLSRVIQMKQLKGELMNIGTSPSFEQMLQSVNLDDFDIVITYKQYMGCEYNIFADKTSWSQSNVSFRSKMREVIESKTEMLLGHDFVFVNPTGTTLSINVMVFDQDGNKMSESIPVNVPLAQGQLTVVKGEFLTSQATSGAVIDPGFDGDHNIYIP